jgi:hypothetical protein
VRHPKDVGDWTTLMVMAVMQEQGIDVYLPFGENTRCDLITYDGRELLRIQCKTGRLRNGCVDFNPCGTYAHHRNPKTVRRNYVSEVDAFAVFCPETSAVYLVPIADIGAQTHVSLRIAPVQNGQRKHVRWAVGYELANVEVY